jgi:carboxyl-terminal processing protease
MKNFNYIFLILAFISCQNQNSIPKEVTEFLTETLDLLEENSVNKTEIDWNEFRIDIFNKAQNAKNIKDTYSTISYAVSKLNDNHSYFKPKEDTLTNSENKPLPVLSDEITPNDIGYVRIPFCIGTENEYIDYISNIRKKIKEQSKKKMKGWIVDLRGNFGGNMWPMLLSVEPLLGNGILGYFVDDNGNSEAWRIIEGKAYIEDQLVMETKILSKQDLSNQFLAVLTDNQTASSGEAVAVAFKLRENSKSFGQSTFGVSTGCVAHELSDGSVINLAESKFADRERTVFGKSIIPDFQVEVNQTLKAGIEWIYKMNNNSQ